MNKKESTIFYFEPDVSEEQIQRNKTINETKEKYQTQYSYFLLKITNDSFIYEQKDNKCYIMHYLMDWVTQVDTALKSTFLTLRFTLLKFSQYFNIN